MSVSMGARGTVGSTAGSRHYLLTPREAAALLGCSVDELRERRETGVQPPYYRVTRRTIRYGFDDVLEALTAA